jgi:CheY-like chemotaxis protein
MNPPANRPILLVEDNETHYEAMARALRQAGCKRPFVRCADGDDALDYVYRRGRFATADGPARPALVLLDLNLPGTGGHEVLATIKSDEELRAIPVIVLTSVGDPGEVRRCYQSGANGFIRKRSGFDETVMTARHINDYWFQASEVPDVF